MYIHVLVCLGIVDGRPYLSHSNDKLVFLCVIGHRTAVQLTTVLIVKTDLNTRWIIRLKQDFGMLSGPFPAFLCVALRNVKRLGMGLRPRESNIAVNYRYVYTFHCRRRVHNPSGTIGCKSDENKQLLPSCHFQRHIWSRPSCLLRA